MMRENNTAEGVVLSLVRSIINNEKPSALPDGITADEIFAIGSRQDMVPITFYVKYNHFKEMSCPSSICVDISYY